MKKKNIDDLGNGNMIVQNKIYKIQIILPIVDVVFSEIQSPVEIFRYIMPM